MASDYKSIFGPGQGDNVYKGRGTGMKKKGGNEFTYAKQNPLHKPAPDPGAPKEQQKRKA